MWVNQQCSIVNPCMLAQQELSNWLFLSVCPVRKNWNVDIETLKDLCNGHKQQNNCCLCTCQKWKVLHSCFISAFSSFHNYWYFGSTSSWSQVRSKRETYCILKLHDSWFVLDNCLNWAVMTCFTDVTIVSAGFSGYFLLFVTLVPPFILMIYILVTKLCIYGSQSLPHLGYGHTQAGRKMPRWKYMQRSVNLWITPGWRRSRWRVSQAKKGNLGDGWMAI